MKLKPCPFCGGEASPLIKPFIGADGSGLVIECDRCWCSTGYYETEAEAIEAWNTRADPEFGVVAMTEENMAAHGWVQERTGHIKEDETGFLVCSECGAIQPEEWTVYYCWSCGARVVG